MNVSVYLRMAPVVSAYPKATSEESYRMHSREFDTAIPCNGGVLQADGSWLQQRERTENAWAQTLPLLAQDNGHAYMPCVSNDETGILSVLGDPVLQVTAARNLIRLASTRYDYPWDGVMLDLERIPSARKEDLSRFYHVLSDHIRQEGLRLGIWARGKVSDPGPDYDHAYANDFSVLARLADWVDLGCYGYWNPIGIVMDRSMGPYWWQQDCISYALSQGVAERQLRLGAGLFSMYYPNSNVNAGRREVVHSQAQAIIAAAGGAQVWVENGAFGIVREWLANLAGSHVWLHDERTLQHSVDLVSDRGLEGLSLFGLGMESEETLSALPSLPTRRGWNSLLTPAGWGSARRGAGNGFSSA
jgi:spore germination protein YaaH